jgi:hypothetical protein
VYYTLFLVNFLTIPNTTLKPINTNVVARLNWNISFPNKLVVIVAIELVTAVATLGIAVAIAVNAAVIGLGSTPFPPYFQKFSKILRVGI